jgi:hypothetical protein
LPASHFDALHDLDAAVANRCVTLDGPRDLIKSQTGFRWWPERIARPDHPELHNTAESMSRPV